MKSPPLDSTHGRTTSGMAFHHRLWAAHTVGRRQAWHAITALEKHTRSNDVGHGMTSPPLDSTHGRTKLAMTCHHCPCTARTVGRRQAWHAITALEKHSRSNDVGHGMTSPTLDRTHGRQRRAWHDITALGQHTQSNDVGRGMTSAPLGSTHGRQRRYGMISPPLDSTHGRTTSGVA